MAKFTNCISDLVKFRKITKGQAEKIQAEADRLANVYRASGKFSEEEIIDKAAHDASVRLLNNVKDEQFRKALDISKYNKLSKEIVAGKQGAVKGLRDTLVHREGVYKQGEDVESLAYALYGQSTTNLGDFIEKFRTKVGGGIDRLWRGRDEAALRDVVRARFGDTSVDPDLKGFADEWGKSVDLLVGRLQKEGVPLHKLEGWGMPQRWSSFKLRDVSEDVFKQDIKPLLDRKRMLTRDGLPMDEKQLDDLLKDVYETLTTDGLNKRAKAGRGVPQGAGSSINAQYSRHRVLHFAGADAWLTMHDKYGEGELFESMMEYLRDLSHDAAIAKRFGTTPDQTFKALQAEAALFDYKKNPNKAGRQPVENSLNDWTYSILTGRSNGVANPLIADIVSGTRNLLTSAKLGGASIMSLGDQAYIKAQADLWGASYGRIIGETLAQLNPLTSKERRAFATRMAFTAEWAHSLASAAGRFSEVSTSGKYSRATARMADFTIRASGLSALTRATRSAFTLELNSFLSRNLDTAFSELPANLKTSLSMHNITEADWSSLRNAIVDVQGQTYIDPTKLVSDNLKDKFTTMMIAEGRMAVPEANAAVRAFTSGPGQRGEVGREIRSSLFQFKSFPITVMMNQFNRLLFDPRLQGTLNKVTYAAKISIMSTALMAAALQLKSVSKGQDTYKLDDSTLWAAAAIQSSSITPLTDLFLSSAKNQGQIATNLIGPVGALGVKVLSLTSSTVRDALAGEETDAGKALVDIFKDTMPGQLFYTKLATDRYILDQLRLAVDPKAHKSFERAEKALRKRTGQEFWWEPGQLTPDRLPDY